MKAREPQVAYLSERTIEIVRNQEGQSTVCVFPYPRNDEEPLSNLALLMTLRRLKSIG